MDLSPFWEAVSRSVTEEFPNSLRNPKVYYHVHKTPPLVPVLIQMNPTYLPKISFNIILSPSMVSFLLAFLQDSYAFCFSPMRAACPAYLSLNLPDYFNYIWWIRQVMILVMQLSFNLLFHILFLDCYKSFKYKTLLFPSSGYRNICVNLI